MHLLLYFLFSLLNPTTIELENEVIITLAEPVNWNLGDELEIHLNKAWFTYFPYKIINLSQNSSALAIIPSQSIFTESAYLRHYDTTIYVREDIYNMKKSGSNWTLYYGSIPSNWEPGDPLLKGFSTNNSNPDLLINLKRNNYIYARFYRYFNLFDDN